MTARAVELVSRIEGESHSMTSFDTFVKFDVSSVGLFQFMTAGKLENNARGTSVLDSYIPKVGCTLDVLRVIPSKEAIQK